MARGGADASLGKNRALRWVQGENGITIDGWRASAMRATAVKIWRQFLVDKQAPRTWRLLLPKLHDEYVQKMEAQYPELRLCSAHYKADLIGIRNYHNFAKKFADDIEGQFPPSDRASQQAGGPICIGEKRHLEQDTDISGTESVRKKGRFYQ